MVISFVNRKLAKTFNSENELMKTYGKNNSIIIKRRLELLRAAPTLNDVPHSKPERRHELAGDRKGEFTVDLKHPFRLVFQPDHDPVPIKKDGGIDLNAVTAIMILNVEDPHK